MFVEVLPVRPVHRAPVVDVCDQHQRLDHLRPVRAVIPQHLVEIGEDLARLLLHPTVDEHAVARRQLTRDDPAVDHRIRPSASEPPPPAGTNPQCGRRVAGLCQVHQRTPQQRSRNAAPPGRGENVQRPDLARR